MESYIIDLFVIGYHNYKDMRSPKVNDKLKTKIEPNTHLKKNAADVIDKDNKIVGHLMKGLSSKFAKNSFLFLRGHLSTLAKLVNLGKN